ncbi:exonuclease SbcCD subunit D C-terminal domain-containing protein [Desulfogranum japonicum]|uniref:exonuclease SbcCD subunit D C-terminal domain-containing protein n=1 Tax=Desulfogranum japonicum TaxID=231447 RepID=UPI0004284B34|nr:exonuclease SbcCD subunit D C-terminal domain-containing protein [Desulfogranum japonicum]
MRILHTSDWHLGHRLYGRNRYDEFAAYLNWLVDYIAEQEIELLLVAGDIFDTTTPGNRALELYYRFLHRISNSPCRAVVIIAGNHDSPTLLEAPKDLLKQFDVHVTGTPATEPRDQVVYIPGLQGDDLLVCAVPFLRDRDIRLAGAGESQEEKAARMEKEIERHYQQVYAAAMEIREERGKPLPVIGMGHLFMTGAKTVDGDGVRDVYVGGLQQTFGGRFPEGMTYFALGHLHLAQRVGGGETIRYSGAPLPMGFNEARKAKVMLQVECDREKLQVHEVPVPAFRELHILKGELPELLLEIAQLKEQGSTAWLEIRHQGVMEAGALRQQLYDAVDDSDMSLLRIRTSLHLKTALAQEYEAQSLDDLSVDEVFERCLQSVDLGDDERIELRDCFQEILSSMHMQDRRSE